MEPHIYHRRSCSSDSGRRAFDMDAVHPRLIGLGGSQAEVTQSGCVVVEHSMRKNLWLFVVLLTFVAVGTPCAQADDIVHITVPSTTFNGSLLCPSCYVTLSTTIRPTYTKTSKILRLSIEPTTMRYVDSTTVTVTVGNGETAATDARRYGPWPGVCEKVPNPK
jgi:hypothetical protein